MTSIDTSSTTNSTTGSSAHGGGCGATGESEPVEDFRARLRAWLPEHMGRAEDAPMSYADGELHRRGRVLQRQLWDGGFAGIRWPHDYGGLGLSADHQRAFDEETVGYELPLVLNVPTFGILAATLLDFGTHEQKLRHIPPILRGDEQWVQFMSEPTGGSDLAGCLTRADRDGDVFVVNGSKIWSSAAHVSDFALVLVRTDWGVPKHRGLTMLIIEIHQPNIEIRQIRQINDSMDFCQEFFADVEVPVTAVVGEINDGWNVASRLLVHERMSLGGASPYTSGSRTTHDHSAGPDRTIVRLAERLGLGGDGAVRQTVADFHVEQLVGLQLTQRLTAAMANGTMPPASGSILKLSHALSDIKRAQAIVEISGSATAIAAPGSERDRSDRDLADLAMYRQAVSLGGGSNEIQRNIISERVLGLPREWAPDRDVPYGEVPRNTMPTGPR